MKSKKQKKTESGKAAALASLMIAGVVLLHLLNNLNGEGTMNRNILGKLPVALASIAATSTGFAAADMESRVDRLEKQMNQVGTDNAFGGYGANTASARPSKEDCNWFIQAGVLFYKPFVGGTEFAYTDTGPNLSYPVRGRTKEMDFDMSFGFRVGLGYNFEFDAWDINSNYTHFSSGDSKSVSASGCANSVIVPLRGAICPDPDITSGMEAWVAGRAKSQYDFSFDTVDLQIGRNYFLSHFLSMRPFFGVKAAWIDLEQETRFCGGPADSANFCGVTMQPLGVNTLKIIEESDFKGVGPEIGFQSKWFLAKGFSFYADALGALLYGFFDVDHKETYSADEDRRICLSANTHKMVPTANIQGGIAYDIFFNDDKEHIGFRFGYDGLYFWRANQTIKIDDAAPLKYERWSEDVSMHGVAFEARWDF